MNANIIIGLIINTISSLLMFLHPEYPEIGLFLLPFLIVHIIGFLLMLSGKKKTGAIIFIIASAFYIPLGLIGVMGARKIIDEENRRNFFSTNKLI